MTRILKGEQDVLAVLNHVAEALPHLRKLVKGLKEEHATGSGRAHRETCMGRLK